MVDKGHDFELENKKRIDFESTNEYKKQRDKKILLKMIKKHHYLSIIKKAINRKRIAKLSHEERENDFHTKDNSKFTGKVAVYTCITGGYDKLEDPCVHENNVDYFAFVDDVSKYDVKGWKIKEIPAEIKELVNNDNVLVNRYVKFHPGDVIDDKYDYAVYIDGNIKVMGEISPLVGAVNLKTGLALHRHRQRGSLYDEIKVCLMLKKGNKKKLKEQFRKYEREGFPKEFGLYECNVIISDLRNKKSAKILDDWWNEFKRSESYRDQIALPYVIWKNGLKYEDVGSLGNNVYRNQKFMLDSDIHKGANE